MIYYLPERIYEVLKNDDEVITKLLEIEEKFEGYNNFKDYISGYSRLNDSAETKELYIRTNNLIRNKLHGNKFLEKEFDINNGDVSLEEMEKWYFFGNESTGIDLENKFFLLSNIMNKAEDHSVYEKYMKEYTSLYQSLDEEDRNKLSKYIHLKAMYALIYCSAMATKNEEDFETNWESLFIDDLHRIYLNTLEITGDIDITTNYYLEAFATAIKRVNYNREQLELYDVSWLRNVIFYILLGLRNEESSDTLFQYETVSIGYLNVLDEIATLDCLNGDKEEFNYILEKIVDYINRALSDNKKLLRGLSFYDKVNHNMFAAVVRKYLKVLAGIKTVLKINGLSDEDKRYILSADLGDITAAAPNKLQEKRTVESVDKTADAMVRKLLEIN